MVFGFAVTTRLIVALGILLFALLLVQVAIGMRWIRLGKRHRVVHRWLAFSIVGLALVHGLLAATLVLGLRIG